jgi:glycosyltransferase involved in cell wall biosynthesis
MKVSIIVPNRNYANFLPVCLDSIASQTYQNIEVLLADGSSEDGSLGILEDYSRRYDWKIFSLSDKGQADAINKGLSIATGDIQCWLNSDDYFLSNKALEKVVEIYQEFSDLDVVSLGGYYTNENGYWLRPVLLNTHPLQRQTDIAFRGAFLQPATFWKRHVFEELNGLDSTYPFSFDSHFLIRAGQRFNMLLDQNIKISGYRLHGSNLSVGVKPERIKELAEFNRYFFGFGFRYLYLNFIAAIVSFICLFPNAISKKINYVIYLINNLASFLSLYRIPYI